MYYPKNKIIIGLKSKQDEFYLDNGDKYSGDYYETFDGKYFTGTGPNDKSSRLIKKIEQDVDNKIKFINNNQNVKFNQINPQLNIDKLIDPISYTPIITELDYKKGNIIRYFAKERKIRIYKIIEINKETFIDIQNRTGIYNYSGWDIVSIFWRISGPLNDNLVNGNIQKVGIISTNKRLIELTNKDFIGIKEYLNNLTQFSK